MQFKLIIDRDKPEEVVATVRERTALIDQLEALMVGGMTAIYQVEQLPLVSAILIHGAKLYAVYILIYLINGWLLRQLVPILIFTAIFLAGYAVIWLCIYFSIKAKTELLNRKLKHS